ncbi:MAG: amidohydrolase family protein [Bacteroidota bacterium]
MRKYFLVLSICCLTYCLPAQITYDIVLIGGTVMDPETEFEGVRNVGILGNKIAEITENELSGKVEIDATDLVVAPGFIDLHVHGMTNKAHAYQVRDGITTALELEAGIPFLKDWIAAKSGTSIVNFGATAPHATIRALAMERYNHFFREAKKVIAEEGMNSPKLTKIRINMGRSAYQSLTEAEIESMAPIFQSELAAGALGIGVPVGYYPGSKHGEIYAVYELAAALQVPIFSHTRGFGMPGIHEAIANATTSGAPLHIVHANSLSLGDIQVTLDMVASAQDRGLDITTEVYPYTAASTSLESAVFDEGWQAEMGITYQDLQWEATGERLTEATFQTYRKQGGTVIIHMMKPEWIVKGIRDERTLIGSDGMPYAPGAHPRTAGTFSRVLGRYVREQRVIGLMEALKKMTIMPAQRLETVAPMMRSKGRLQVGADADITIFDPITIIDKADFKKLAYSEGVKYVLVNGQLVVENQQILPNVFPGIEIVSKYRR